VSDGRRGKRVPRVPIPAGCAHGFLIVFAVVICFVGYLVNLLLSLVYHLLNLVGSLIWNITSALDTFVKPVAVGICPAFMQLPFSALVVWGIVGGFLGTIVGLVLSLNKLKQADQRRRVVLAASCLAFCFCLVYGKALSSLAIRRCRRLPNCRLLHPLLLLLQPPQRLHTLIDPRCPSHGRCGDRLRWKNLHGG